MNIKARYTAPILVVLTAVSLAAAPVALAKPLEVRPFTAGHLAEVNQARHSVPVSSNSTSTLPVSDSKAPTVVLSHAAQAHAGGSQYLSASQPPPSGSSGSSWSTAGVVLGVFAILVAVAGLGGLLISAATRNRRRHAISSH
jgi:hypothetical protein